MTPLPTPAFAKVSDQWNSWALYHPLFKEAKQNGNLVADRARETTEGMHTDTFVRYMVKGDAFTPESLSKISEKFHIKSIHMITIKSLRYLFRHPIIAGKCANYLVRSLIHSGGRISSSIVKLFFCKLFYQSSLLQESAIIRTQKN